MFRRILALASLAFLCQGCVVSMQTNPEDLSALKSLVVSNALRAASNPNSANAPTVIVVAPTPHTASLAAPALTAEQPAPVTRRLAGDQQPEVREDSHR